MPTVLYSAVAHFWACDPSRLHAGSLMERKAAIAQLDMTFEGLKKLRQQLDGDASSPK